MTRHNTCNPAEHRIARRRFLGGVSAGMCAGGGLLSMAQRGMAKQLHAADKRMLVIFLAGGVSQLESWDPKPKTDTGGPFRAIPTSVPGLHISELLPHTAKLMHHLSVIRSVNTKEDDHGKGAYIMQTGRRQEPSIEYPQLGSVAARYLNPEESALPGYIHITPGGGGVSKDAAFLGPRYGAVTLGNGQPPSNSVRPEALSPEADLRRNALRRRLNERFQRRRRSAETEAFGNSFEQASQLMKQRVLFDVSQEPAAEQERYGSHDFGRHCLLARRLLENDLSFVKVTHTNYDTHHENFNFHIEQLGEFDRTFATLMEDLAQRGLLEHTLVVVMSEFGRTPRINHQYGRDHWSKAWSVALGGCGIQRGAVVGQTNANGTEVAQREVHGGHLFHTYLKAVGIDPHHEYTVSGRPVPMADPEAEAVEELLA
jgi:uncharacterized protein (DUF1501 family)